MVDRIVVNVFYGKSNEYGFEIVLQWIWNWLTADSTDSVTLFGECTLSFLKITNTGKFCLSCLILTMYSLIWIDKRCWNIYKFVHI